TIVASLAPHRRINADRLAHLKRLGNPPIAPLDSDSAENAVDQGIGNGSSNRLVGLDELDQLRNHRNLVRRINWSAEWAGDVTWRGEGGGEWTWNGPVRHLLADGIILRAKGKFSRGWMQVPFHSGGESVGERPCEYVGGDRISLCLRQMRRAHSASLGLLSRS